VFRIAAGGAKKSVKQNQTTKKKELFFFIWFYFFPLFILHSIQELRGPIYIIHHHIIRLNLGGDESWPTRISHLQSNRQTRERKSKQEEERRKTKTIKEIWKKAAVENVGK
jgi:hypothetical protein